MGIFTNDMTKLRSHIDNTREQRLFDQNARIFSVRSQLLDFATTRVSDGIENAKSRATFVNNNAHNVTRLINAFQHFRQVMGRQGREERAAFVNDVSKQTLTLLTDFNVERKNMAERSAKERAEFVTANKNSVGTFINQASQDRAGAHAVFFGTVKKKVSFLV
jgi:hypothetical protein